MAEESELPVTSNAVPEVTERVVVPGDNVPSISNVQPPPPAAVPSTVVADNASTLASLRMVYRLKEIFAFACVYLEAFYFLFFNFILIFLSKRFLCWSLLSELC